jgi:hypothetical protein
MPFSFSMSLFKKNYFCPVKSVNFKPSKHWVNSFKLVVFASFIALQGCRNYAQQRTREDKALIDSVTKAIRSEYKAIIDSTLSATKSNDSNKIGVIQKQIRPSTGCKLKIGQAYAGGLIFHLNPGIECHGLVCAPSDQAYDIPWDDAVAFCRSLSLGGYSDWRLPSKNELNQLWRLSNNTGLGGFALNTYWSSTEANIDVAWTEGFGSGYQSANYISLTYGVRAVRTF